MNREEMEKHIGRRFKHHGKLYDIIGIMTNVDDIPSFAVSEVIGTSVVGYVPEFAISQADEYEKKSKGPAGLCQSCTKLICKQGQVHCKAGLTFFKVDLVQECSWYETRQDKPERDILVYCSSGVVVTTNDITQAPAEFIKMLKLSLNEPDMAIRFDCYYMDGTEVKDQRGRVIVGGKEVGILPGKVG